MLNRKQSQSQRKLRRSSKWNIRNSSSKITGLRNISTQLNPRKQLIHHQQYKINQKGPRYIIKLMKQCIKGNHYQAMPIQRINFSYKPKEITSTEKLRREKQFLEIKLANQVKLVRQRLSEGPAGSLLSGHK
ncbi:Hypothetical_protein [Hexamita inflata]|uniref:Hypothetical_protein n=1 Tax=Hexamita inflata TaxID=28002 RepID=A0AA86N8W3_9EUKA|nr:Hypothetical protein HINF_LOCUS2630 [Hexamita inflata]